MSKKLSRIAIIALFFAALIFGIYSTTKSVAATATANLSPVYKILLKDVATCYANQVFKPEVSFSSLSRGATINDFLQKPNVKVLIPNGLIGILDDKTKEITCKELLDGRNTFFHGDSSGIIKDAGALPSRASSSEEIDSFLKKLGYQPPENNARKCFRYAYDYSMVASGGFFGMGLPDPIYETRYTDYICAEVDSNNKATKVEIDKSSASTDIVQFELKNSGTRIQLDCNTQWFGDGGCGAFNVADYDWDGLQNAILAELGGKNSTKYYSYNTCAGMTECYFPIIYEYTYKLTTTEHPVDQNVNGDLYTLGIDADQSLLDALSGSKIAPSITEDDVASLYITYLLRYFDAEQVCDLNDQQKIVYQNSYGAVEYRPNSEGKACYVYPNKHKTDAVNSMVKIGNSYYINSAGIDFKGIVEWLRNYKGSVDVDLDTATPLDPDPSTMPGSGSGSGSGGNNDTVSECIEAAGALGWILCPVLDMASDATEKLYSYIENNFLWIGESVMGSNSETHEAWKTFRDYANIVFIIMFLIVILSQITGFGISNYGIKKVLPRLIAVALLTNLSFIICQLAVDLSDIIGSGLNTALSGIGGIEDAKVATYGVNSIVADARAALFGTGATVLIIGGLTWRIWLLPLLLAIIGALVGVFVFFLSLAVREAGIIILVVLCPVAIICYALPNTKKLFDKWFRMFTSLLMVYPICGLLMGGGQFASRLLVGLSTDPNENFMFLLTAMLLSVVPFFFIPTIVRTSLNAIGQLGARLSNFGRGIGGRLTSGIRNSEGFRNRQRELAAQRDEKTVRRLDNWSKVRKAVGLNGYSKSGQRKRSLAYARADKVRRDDLIGQSYNGRALLRDDETRQNQLLGNLAAKDFDERVAGAKAAYRDKPEMATEDSIVAEHSRLLEQFGNNPNDTRLQSQLRALEEMAMEKGAPGQDKLQQSFARYITKNKDDWNDNRKLAMSKLGAGMATRYGKELNGSDKGFNVMMNHLADGSITKEGRLDSFQGDDNSGYRSSYDTKLAGFTAAGMSKATPGALERGYDA